MKLIERLKELDNKGYTSMTGAIGNEAAIEIEKLNYHREGLLIDLAHSLEREDTLKAKVADLEHEKDGMAKAYGFLVIERDRACEQHHEVARKLFELERAQPLAALVRDQEQRISELEWERDELERLFGVAFKQCEALKAQAGESVMPAYGQIPWKDLVDAIGEAQGCTWEPDDSYYIGHQPVSINTNSLNRIVSKFANSTTERRVPDNDLTCPKCQHENNVATVICSCCGETYTLENAAPAKDQP